MFVLEEFLEDYYELCFGFSRENFSLGLIKRFENMFEDKFFFNGITFEKIVIIKKLGEELQGR